MLWLAGREVLGSMNEVLFVVAILLLLKLGAELWLDFLNRREVFRHAGDVPEAYASYVDEASYDKSVAYTLAKNRLSMVDAGYQTVVLAILLFSGVLPWLWYGLTGMLGTGLWGQAASVFLLFMLFSLADLPLDWYQQFRLEERFGFNKSSPGLWIMDKLKGLLIGAVLGIPVLALILWLVSLSPLWWIWAFVAFFLFQLVMMVVYPMFIMPLFNKFEELPEGSLRERLFDLGDRTGFRAKTILVMDGSRRSAHSNAFFTGFGRFRRIVLFDTLIEQMEEPHLEAVLAHEIGHYKLGHIPRLLLLSAAFLFVSFLVLAFLLESAWFMQAFGFNAGDGLGPVLLLFGLLSGLVTFWTTPLMNGLSRKHEYEADAFARKALGEDPEPLRDALRILNEKNLSNLTPHPLYSAFHYSHPTLLERERALVGSR